MTVVILGANGQLGRALAARYPDATALGREDLDIADPTSVAAFEWGGVNTVLNAAAYTRVDDAETQTGRRRAWRTNAQGPRNLVRVATEHALTLVHISSDYVFDGTMRCHNEAEALSPLGVYGQSKAAGDIAVSLAPDHYLVRASWLVGDGANFVRSMLHKARRGEPVSVVNDQVGRLTFTTQLVEAVVHLLTTRPAPGTYHCSSDGQPASWAEVARAVYAKHGSADAVTEIDTAEYRRNRPATAPRPLHSTLDLAKIKASGLVLADWRATLDEYVRRSQT